MKGLPCFATVATSAMVVTPSPRTRFAPLPLVARGLAWGSYDFARGAIVISPRHPPPHPPPQGGREQTQFAACAHSTPGALWTVALVTSSAAWRRYFRCR